MIRPSDGKYHIPYAYLGLSDTWVPSTLDVYGDLHANGQLSAYAWCKSNVSASDYIWWNGSGPPTSVTPYATPFYAAPSVTAAQFASYTILGVKYTAYTSYAKTNMTSSDATALNAISMSATNPGRIMIMPSGSFTLQKNAKLNGTLVIRGNLYIDNNGVEITPVADYPALVVFGHIIYTNLNAALVCNGSLICLGCVYDNSLVVNLTVTGSMIMGWGFDTVGTGDNLRATYDCAKATFWDFSRSATRLPMTVLNWTEE